MAIIEKFIDTIIGPHANWANEQIFTVASSKQS